MHSHEPDARPLPQRLLYYINPVDGRYEDLFRGDWRFNVFRDFAAGLIVALVAIPLLTLIQRWLHLPRIRAAVDGVIIASAVLLVGSGATLAIDAIRQLMALKS